MSRRHVQQRRSNAGLRVEKWLSGEGWDGVWGDIRTRLVLEISKCWFGLLLVPKRGEISIFFPLCLDSHAHEDSLNMSHSLGVSSTNDAGLSFKYHLTCRPSGGRDCCSRVFPRRSSSSRAEFPGVEPNERG